MSITHTEIPYTDFKVNINNYIRTKWQTLWDTFPDNKLHTIQPKVGLAKNVFSGSRREDLVLTRARIGHAYITHAYLLRSENIPMCITCSCPLTVKHILIECVDWASVRLKYFNVPDLQKLFQVVGPSQIFEFLREVDLYKKF